MPQITLEYTTNLPKNLDFGPLLSNIHQLLQQLAQAELCACKSRILPCEHYHIGDGDPKHASVYLQIDLLSGRSDKARIALKQAALEALTTFFAQIAHHCCLQLAVKVSEMPIAYYAKALDDRTAS